MPFLWDLKRQEDTAVAWVLGPPHIATPLSTETVHMVPIHSASGQMGGRLRTPSTGTDSASSPSLAPGSRRRGSSLLLLHPLSLLAD